MIYYLSFNWYFWFTMGTICAWIEYERSTRLCRTRVAPHNGASNSATDARSVCG